MITRTEYKILSIFNDGNQHTVEQISKATKLPYKEALHISDLLVTKRLLDNHPFDGYMRSKEGTLAKVEYEDKFRNNLFDKLIYPISQNIASHILVLFLGFLIGLFSSEKLYRLIQIIFHR